MKLEQYEHMRARPVRAFTRRQKVTREYWVMRFVADNRGVSDPPLCSSNEGYKVIAPIDWSTFPEETWPRRRR